MLAVCPSPRAAVSVSCSVVAVGGRLSAFAEKTPCHVPEPSDERPICVPCVPIVTFCTLVVARGLGAALGVAPGGARFCVERAAPVAAGPGVAGAAVGNAGVGGSVG